MWLYMLSFTISVHYTQSGRPEVCVVQRAAAAATASKRECVRKKRESALLLSTSVTAAAPALRAAVQHQTWS
jgi:hypothetical protein